MTQTGTWTCSLLYTKSSVFTKVNVFETISATQTHLSKCLQNHICNTDSSKRQLYYEDYNTWIYILIIITILCQTHSQYIIGQTICTRTPAASSGPATGMTIRPISSPQSLCRSAKYWVLAAVRSTRTTPCTLLTLKTIILRNLTLNDDHVILITQYCY